MWGQGPLRRVRKRQTGIPDPAGFADWPLPAHGDPALPLPPPPLTATTAPSRALLPSQPPPPPPRCKARPPRPARPLLADRVTSAGFKADFRSRRQTLPARGGGGGGG